MSDQWAALANSTKWNELQLFMSTLGKKAPYWKTRATNGFVYPSEGWDGDWTYHFRLGGYKCIEWCEMTPRMYDDAISLFEISAICKKIGFEYDVLENSVRIIGYRKL